MRNISSLASFSHKARSIVSTHPYLTATAALMSALAVTALASRHLAKKALRDNPPLGQFLTVDGVRLHYLEKGAGEPLVLLHGNGKYDPGLLFQWACRLGREKLSRDCI